MHILDVQITGQSVMPETGTHRATILMQATNNRVNLSAIAKLPATAPADDIHHHLINDALRQLKRLPEYRSGEKTISLADNALPDFAPPT